MYLYNCFDNMWSARTRLLELCEKHEYEVNWKESILAKGINSYLVINKKENGDNAIQLSEFPGNCSSIVLSNIEWQFIQRGEGFLQFSIEFCKLFNYALLFVTGTNESCKNWLIDNGFKVVLEDVINPHSGNVNYFAALNIQEMNSE